jgi:pimeloyl-ACP methyl ester carboxylesterase
MAALDGLASGERRREQPANPPRLSRQKMDWDDVRVFLAVAREGSMRAAGRALAGKEPLFSGDYLTDRHSATFAEVKAVIGFYGVYDMQAQWHHDQITRPRDQITEKFLGVSPMQSRRVYFDASPISYATVDKNEKTRTRFLLIHGTNDDIVDPQTQSQAFLTALKQVGFFARTIVVPGSGHFWASEPVEEPGSYGAQAAPQMLRFLRDAL